MGAAPLVSVLMPVYNGEKYLREAIDSILAQTFADFEFIIIDDGSTDHTAKILAEIGDNRIRRITHDLNLGLIKSLNEGIALSRGEYVARMDADDISYPARFEKQVKYLDANTECGLVGSWSETIDMKGLVRREYHPPTDDETIQAYLLHDSCFTHSAVMMRRKLLVEAGGYNQSALHVEDYDLWVRLSRQCKLANVPLVLQQWRETPRGVTSRHRQFQLNEVREIARREITEGILPPPGGLDRLEYALACHPQNDLLYALYAAASDKDSNWLISGERLLPRLMIESLRSKDDPSPLNKLSEYYGHANNESMRLLCGLWSLSLSPEQRMVYDFLSSRLLKWEDQRSELAFSLQETKCTVSVIMATYNRPETIAEAIQSVLNQTFQDYELIIINDGGSNETEEIVRGFDSPRIIYARTPHQGPSAARNEGLKRAQGTYITYLDDDDVIYPNHLDCLVKMAQESVSPVFCSKVIAVLGERRGGEFVGLTELWPNSEFSLERLRVSPIMPDLSVMHTKQSLEEIGAFNEELRQCEDWDLWARYARRFPITRGNDITGEYRITTTNTTRQRPERTEFYSRLMGYYLGSEWGLSILAVAAHKLGEKEDCERWIKLLSEECVYLSSEQLARIVEVALDVTSEASQRLLSTALERQPAVFIKTWIKCLASSRLPALLTRISLKDYIDMARFVVRNPRYCASRAMFRIQPRLWDRGSAKA